MDTSFEDFSKMLALIRLTLLNVGRLTSLWAKMQFEQLYANSRGEVEPRRWRLGLIDSQMQEWLL